MKSTRKIIRIDENKCNGCGLCVPACAEGAIAIIDGKARLVDEKFCDGLGACLGECPQDALTIIEAEAEAFDQQAVEEHLQAPKPVFPAAPPTMPCGCPSQLIQVFPTAAGCEKNTMPSPPGCSSTSASALAHWPVQIRLTPPTAAFLRHADLLVAADCTPVAYAGFHQDFLSGKTVLIGCPKLDDTSTYVDKFTEIFKNNNIVGVTVLVMEVPCCQGLPEIVKKALARAGRPIPLEVVTVSLRGKIIKRG